MTSDELKDERGPTQPSETPKELFERGRREAASLDRALWEGYLKRGGHFQPPDLLKCGEKIRELLRRDGKGEDNG